MYHTSCTETRASLYRKVNVLRSFPECLVLLAQILIHLHVPTGLPHHPDRRSVHLLSAQHAQHERIVCLCTRPPDLRLLHGRQGRSPLLLLHTGASHYCRVCRCAIMCKHCRLPGASGIETRDCCRRARPRRRQSEAETPVRQWYAQEPPVRPSRQLQPDSCCPYISLKAASVAPGPPSGPTPPAAAIAL